MPAQLTELAKYRLDGLATVVIERDRLPSVASAPITVDLLLDDLVEPPSASPAERSVHRASLSSRRGGGGRAVLVTDASPIARKFLTQRLAALGYDVHFADSGERALAMIGQRPFAIVFTELALAPAPGIDGIALCHAIKQRADHPRGIEPAVVVVAGRAASADRVRASMVGCDAFLKKPLAEDAFLAALGEVDPLFS